MLVHITIERENHRSDTNVLCIRDADACRVLCRSSPRTADFTHVCVCVCNICEPITRAKKLCAMRMQAEFDIID